jgi:hypothetical protein
MEVTAGKLVGVWASLLSRKSVRVRALLTERHGCLCGGVIGKSCDVSTGINLSGAVFRGIPESVVQANQRWRK